MNKYLKVLLNSRIYSKQLLEEFHDKNKSRITIIRDCLIVFNMVGSTAIQDGKVQKINLNIL